MIGKRFRAVSPASNAPTRTREFLSLQLANRAHQSFAALFLDNRRRMIKYVELFRGTIDGESVHPREVVKDELITRPLHDALLRIDIRGLDHIFIGEPDALWFA